MTKKTKTYIGVESLLRENRVSPMSGVSPRDSDTELLIQFMQLILNLDLNAQQLNLIRTMNSESITRARRKLQEQGLYLPSPKVARARRLKGYEIEQTAPSETASGLQNRIERNLV